MNLIKMIYNNFLSILNNNSDIVILTILFSIFITAILIYICNKICKQDNFFTIKRINKYNILLYLFIVFINLIFITLFLGDFNNNNFYLISIQFLMILYLAIMITIVDIEIQIIPFSFSIPLVLVGIIFPLIYHEDWISLKLSIIGCVIGYFIPSIINYLYKIVRKQDGMGGGDFKLFAGCGAILGAYALPSLIFISCLIHVILYFSYYIFNKNKIDDINQPVAFAPAIMLSLVLHYMFFICNLYNGKVSNFYFDLFMQI